MNLAPALQVPAAPLTHRAARDGAAGGIGMSLLILIPTYVVCLGAHGVLLLTRVPLGRMSIAVAFAALLVLGLLRGHRGGRTGRKGAVASLAALFVWLPVLMAGAFDLTASKVSTPLAWLCKYEAGPYVVTPLLMLYALAAVLLATLARHRGSDPLLRLLALGSVLTVTFAALFAVAHLGERDPDDPSYAFRSDEAVHAPAPPIGWTVGAILGAAVGGALLRLAKRRSRGLPSSSLVQGVLREDGWISFSDRPPMALPVSMRLPGGDVVVEIEAEETDRAPFRVVEAAKVITCQPGTLDDARRLLQDRAAALHTFALTASLLCGAPLFSWWIARLAFVH